MRILKPLGLACCLTFGGNAFADSASPHAAGPSVIHVSSSWQASKAGAGYDRLRYLGGGSCLEQRGCSAATPYADESRRRTFVDALDIGSYGPMDVKFTGNRVKLKVWF